MASLAFFVTLLGVVAVVGLAWRLEDARRRRVARSAVWIVLAPLFSMLGAPVVASVAVGTGVVAFFFDQDAEPARTNAGRPRWRRLWIAAWSLLVFVALGTLARQVVTHGATITERPDYGAQALVLGEWGPMAWPVVGLLVMWALLGAVARREGEAEATG